MAIPVYAFTGFLDAGKTKFIQETLEDERFNAGERTLLLICEEGEEEYDLSVYPYQHVYPEVIDQEAVTTEELSQLFKKHHCERVVVELNGMLQVGPFYQKMPEDWQIAQEVMFADGTSILAYNANMRSLVVDKLTGCEMVVFNRLAPGTDIMPLLKNEVRDDKDFVFLKKIPELHVLEEKDGELIIGAAMTLTELAESELLNSRYAAIAQAASLTASPQIRNIATVGGNIMQDRRCIYFNQPHLWRSGLAYCFKTGGSICHQIPNSPVCRAIYYSDVATALIAYEAEVEYIEDGETHRTDLASLIERHSVANGLACHEHLPILVTRFFIPAAEKGERSGFYKYAMRTTIDFPIINFALRCGGNRPARLAAGAVAPHPVVMAETAAKIDSDATDDEVIAQAEDELRKLAMPIKEACMTPAVKRSLYRHVAMLLDLRK